MDLLSLWINAENIYSECCIDQLQKSISVILDMKSKSKCKISFTIQRRQQQT